MTTKQSARLRRKSVNRDCFVVLHTLHHISALLAMTRSSTFQKPLHIKSFSFWQVLIRQGVRADTVSCDEVLR